MGTREFNPGSRHPRSQGDGEYVIHLGTVRKALLGILSDQGLNIEALDRLIRELVVDRIDARISHLLSNTDIEGRILSRLIERAMHSHGHLTNLVRELIREEVKRLVGDHLSVTVGLNYEGQKAPVIEGPYRNIRREGE